MPDKTLIIVALMIFLFLVVLLFARRRVLLQQKFKQIQSIKLNLLLKSLLICIQKQRGLCARHNVGDALTKAAIEKLLRDNEELINSLEYKYSDFLNDDPRWRHIRIDWSLLKANAFILDAENIFIYHNLLIENIIYMMEDIAHKGQDDAHKTMTDDDIKTIWCDIPQTLEALGRTRVIGSSMALEGVCTRENKNKLKHLSAEIIKNYKHIYSKLDQITAEEMNRMSPEIIQSIDDFVLVVHDKLIIPEVPEVAADVFFDQATQAMEGISRLFDALSTVKEKQIRKAAA